MPAGNVNGPNSYEAHMKLTNGTIDLHTPYFPVQRPTTGTIMTKPIVRRDRYSRAYITEEIDL